MTLTCEGGALVNIRGNATSLRSWRSLVQAYTQFDKSQARLSSGLRINTAAEGASGLAISHRLTTQFRGLNQAVRNATDGLSLVNTADGSMNTIQSLLQRANVLSVQAANGTLTDSDRQHLQSEFQHILTEIDRIADSTSFNGKSLLSIGGNSSALAATMNGLQSGWLEQAEAVIGAQYGLWGDLSGIRVVFENSGQQAAWISGTPGPGGRLNNLSLHINLADFGSVPGPDGGLGPVYNDRKVARALTQAVLARNANFVSLNSWFVSGASDFIAGRNEQLLADVNSFGAAAVVGAISSWSEDSLHHSSAYLAVKYLDSMLAPFAMADVMFDLAMGNDLNTALLNTVGIDVATFMADFQANGAAFLGTLNLTDPDVGGIGGGDASGVIPNGGTFSTNPLAGFTIEWATGTQQPLDVILQVGANAGEQLTISIPQISTANLGLIGLNLVTNAGAAITRIEAAIRQVSSARAYLGGVGNRMDHIVNVNLQSSETQLNGFSHIMDLDMAKEMANLTRQQILVASSTAMLSQANSSHNHVSILLSGLRLR